MRPSAWIIAILTLLFTTVLGAALTLRLLVARLPYLAQQKLGALGVALDFSQPVSDSLGLRSHVAKLSLSGFQYRFIATNADLRVRFTGSPLVTLAISVDEASIASIPEPTIPKQAPEEPIPIGPVFALFGTELFITKLVAAPLGARIANSHVCLVGNKLEHRLLIEEWNQQWLPHLLWKGTSLLTPSGLSFDRHELALGPFQAVASGDLSKDDKKWQVEIRGLKCNRNPREFVLSSRWKGILGEPKALEGEARLELSKASFKPPPTWFHAKPFSVQGTAQVSASASVVVSHGKMTAFNTKAWLSLTDSTVDYKDRFLKKASVPLDLSFAADKAGTGLHVREATMRLDKATWNLRGDLLFEAKDGWIPHRGRGEVHLEHGDIASLQFERITLDQLRRIPLLAPFVPPATADESVNATGAFILKSGVATFSNLSLHSSTYDATASKTVFKLANMTIESQLKVNPRPGSLPTLLREFLKDETGNPSLTLNIDGPLQNPIVVIEPKTLEQRLARFSKSKEKLRNDVQRLLKEKLGIEFTH